MLFSILIANYNNARYIGETIQSVRDQTYSDWEIIIVDDASTDNSVEIIEHQQNNGVNIKLFRHGTNEGCGATKNDCVRHASGDICGFLDPDDTIVPDALETMVEEHRKYPDASLVYSTYNHCDNDLNIKHTSGWVTAIPKNATNLHTDYISHFASFKRDRYLQTGGINRELKSAVDKDLYYKLEETGKVVFVPKTLYNYRENEHGVSQFSNILAAQNNHIAVIKDAMNRRRKSKLKNLSTFEFNRKYSRMLVERASLLARAGDSKAAILKHLAMSFLLCPLCNHSRRIQVIRELAGNSVQASQV